MMEHTHRFHQMSRQNRRCKMDYIPGMIIMAGWNYVPTNWLLCDGSVYPANSYQSLFNVIGNSYGGNSGKSFAVPNLSYRMPLGAGPMPASSIVFSLVQQGGGSSANFDPSKYLKSHSHQHGMPIHPAYHFRAVWKCTTLPALHHRPSGRTGYVD